jgi:hypothetical protein
LPNTSEPFRSAYAVFPRKIEITIFSHALSSVFEKIFFIYFPRTDLRSLLPQLKKRAPAAACVQRQPSEDSFPYVLPSAVRFIIYLPHAALSTLS